MAADCLGVGNEATGRFRAGSRIRANGGARGRNLGEYGRFGFFGVSPKITMTKSPTIEINESWLAHRGIIEACRMHRLPYHQHRADLPARSGRAPGAFISTFFGRSAAYGAMMVTRPQTIGYALADSPSGLAAWTYEKGQVRQCRRSSHTHGGQGQGVSSHRYSARKVRAQTTTAGLELKVEAGQFWTKMTGTAGQPA